MASNTWLNFTLLTRSNYYSSKGEIGPNAEQVPMVTPRPVPSLAVGSSSPQIGFAGTKQSWTWQQISYISNWASHFPPENYGLRVLGKTGP